MADPALFEALLSLVPVLLLLASLMLLDSFKLVGISIVAATLVAGALAALASLYAGGAAMELLHQDFPAYSRFGAPVLEEAIKALVVLSLFAMGRIGFLVDAAILGLCVGAGFSVLENIYYAFVFPEANAAVWLVRGLGTAIMHGGATALFALAGQTMREESAEVRPLDYVPGFLAAVSVHTIFNQFSGYDVASAAGTVLLLPMVLLFLFYRSERQMHDCLAQEYESHETLLADLNSGRFRGSRAGRVIGAWAARRDPALVAAVFEYIRLHTDLVLKAEALLLAQDAGRQVAGSPPDPADFARLHLLERRIGRSALATLRPHLKFTRRELFELHRLERLVAA